MAAARCISVMRRKIVTTHEELAEIIDEETGCAELLKVVIEVENLLDIWEQTHDLKQGSQAFLHAINICRTAIAKYGN